MFGSWQIEKAVGRRLRVSVDQVCSQGKVSVRTAVEPGAGHSSCTVQFTGHVHTQD